MKSLLPLTSRAVLTVAAFSLLGLTACSKKETQDTKSAVSNAADAVADKSKEVYKDTKDALANAWDSVKGTSYDQRDKFVASAKEISAKAEARLSKMQADYAEGKASESQKAAMAKLKSSAADFNSKVSALGDATADTWDAAKKNVIAAWDKMVASYHEAGSAK